MTYHDQCHYGVTADNEAEVEIEVHATGAYDALVGAVVYYEGGVSEDRVACGVNIVSKTVWDGDQEVWIGDALKKAFAEAVYDQYDGEAIETIEDDGVPPYRRDERGVPLNRS